MQTRLCLFYVVVLFQAAAQNAFFSRTTIVPAPGLNVPFPAAILAADLNRDGIGDLVIGGEGSVVILAGQPGGEFVQSQSFPILGQGAAIVVADFNQDGNPDLAILLPDNASVAIFPAAGDGTFRGPVSTALPAVNSRPVSMATGDFDEDGKPDLTICYLSGDTITLNGTGNNGFHAGVTLRSGPALVMNTQVLVADLNRDGHADLVVGRTRVSSVGVYLGKGNGSFAAEQPITAGRDPAALLAADIDGDGVIDLVTGSSAGDGTWLLSGNGDGGFRPPIALPWSQGASGFVAVDWNGDGLLDIAASLPNGRALSVIYGKGGSAFSEPKNYPAGNAPAAVVSGDFDSDGSPDIAVLNRGSESVSTLLSRSGEFIAGPTFARFRPAALAVLPSGTPGISRMAVLNSSADEALVFGVGSDGRAVEFARLSTGREPTRLAVGDFDQDGVADLAVANIGSSDLSLIRGRADGTYEPELRLNLGRQIAALAVADVDGDSKPDLIVAFSVPASLAVLTNRGDQGFDLPRLIASPGLPFAVAAADLNGDGAIDLALADPGQGLLLLRGNGDGSFQPATLVESRQGLNYVRTADLNADGKPDLIALDLEGNAFAYINSPDGLRSTSPVRAGQGPVAAAVEDLNGDGTADLAVAVPIGRAVMVSFGSGGGSFQTGRFYPAGDVPSGIVALDINGDGRQDLAVSTGGGLVILWNDPTPAPPLAPRLLAPINNASISQNDTASGCPADPLRGSGYRISFQWTASDPVNLRGYELFATAHGAPQPIVNMVLPPVPLYTTSQCAYVPDSGLDGWEWRVRGLALSGPDSPWSDLGTFRFLPCRFPDGRACGTSPPPPPGGSSVPAAVPNIERARHTATLLNDGRVLIAGGDNYNTGRVVELGVAELYDPKSGQFTVTGPMRVRRAQHTATLLADGRVLLAGGLSYLPPPAQPAALADAELFNPATGQFTSAGSMAQVRAGHAAVRLNDGRVLIVGGTTFPATSGFASAEIFNPATNTFTATGSLNFSRYFHTATLLSSGQVLVAGGVGPLSMLAELYDPARGTFTTTQPPVFQQFAHTATLMSGGVVLLAGGWSMNGPTASMQVFDSATGRFQSLNPLPLPRQLHQATSLPDGTILFTGGASTSGQRIPVVERFLPSSRGLFPLPTMLSPRAEHTATLLQDGRVLIVGGTSGTDQGISWWRSAELYSVGGLP